ncbi:MAG TPA: ATP-binding cassette domain-containing protein [Candidatus Cloacimonadota bacterium]|nr:ATP-binding cassette domain-containing protein [Candidatus Cloacimonadota bacterium]
MISIKNLHKTFNPGTINEVYALRGVDLEVQSGEWITVIGTNGSGKSTLLNAIAGSFQPDQGSIQIDDEDLTAFPSHRRAHLVARVFQNPFQGTAPNMTIAENLHLASLRGKQRLPLVHFGKARIEEYAQLIKTLEMQLENRLDNVIGMLSGGQRQAITLLMAVMTKPKVILLDEHTAALDPKTAAQIIRLTRRFIEENHFTAVMVTHSMQQALELGTRTIMMNKGQIIDDLDTQVKKRLTVNDLLDKFAELRKAEQLTDEMLDRLRREYM